MKFCNLFQYTTNSQWVESSPLRTITVRDTMSDLPEIRNGHRREEISYGTDPESHFQRLVGFCINTDNCRGCQFIFAFKNIKFLLL